MNYYFNDRSVAALRTLLFRLPFLFVLLSLNLFGQESYNWQNVAIGGGGFVSAVIADPNDPNVFYARTDVGGAYRWDETTASWIPLLDWVSADERGLLGIDGIAVDPQVTGRVYLLAGTTYWNNGRSMFLRSDDYGKTWDKIDVTNQFRAHGNGMGRGNGERIAIDPNNSNLIYIGSRFQGMWRSADRGDSWSQVTSFPLSGSTANENGIPTIVFDASSVSGGVSQTIYAGVSQANDNLYVSNDGGSNWSLIPGRPTVGAIMPQRIAINSDGSLLYITYGNGAGPHPQLWNGVTDYYNRGGLFKYEVATGTWTDISPDNFMLDIGDTSNPAIHYGAYSGVAIDPGNEDRILTTTINSYRGTQYWNNDGTYVESWGDNIYLSEDGGATWREMFRYYWQDGGFSPDYEMLDDHSIPWIRGSNIHWSGGIVFDPFNTERALVTSGNGVWSTQNLSDYYSEFQWIDEVQVEVKRGKSTWRFEARGIEETVPEDIVTPIGGSAVSVILDYDGFVHENLQVHSPYGRHRTDVNGTGFSLGSTTGLDYAQGAGVFVKAARTRSVSTQYSEISIGPVQWSTDGGLSWTTQTYISNPPSNLSGGRVAISTDGEVTLWMPEESSTMYRYENSAWTEVSGLSAQGIRPEADKVNASIFYSYVPGTGAFYVSTDKGVSFTQTANAGTGIYETVRAVPGYEGHVWVPLTEGGLTRTTDRGQTFTAIAGVTYCEAVGLGKAAPGASYLTVFIYGTVGGVTGIFRSTDEGASWVRVNDDEHEYGGLANGEFVKGDLNVFGRVYMSTAGRGIVYGEPSGTTPVNQPPLAVASSDVTSGDVPLTVSFDASASSDPDGDEMIYNWSFGDGASATGVVVSHTYTSEGTHAASVVVSDGNGGASSASLSITVTGDAPSNTDPEAVLSSDVTSGRVPLLVNFDASGSSDADGDDLTFVWDFGDGSTAVGVGASHTYAIAGTYTTSVTVTDGNGGTDASSILITVTDPDVGDPCDDPTAISLPFSHDGVGSFCWETSETIAYVNSWNTASITINGEDFTNIWSNNLPPKIAGSYFINYTSDVAWGHFEVTGSSSARMEPEERNEVQRPVEETGSFMIFPNPASRDIYIQLREPSKFIRLLIYTVTGSLVYQAEETDAKQSLLIKNTLKAGVYNLHLQTDKGFFSEKLIIE